MKKSRLEKYRDGGAKLEDLLPSLSWGDHLVDALLEIGPATPGPEPVSWQEIEAWSRITRTELPGYEALLLRDLSLTYCAEFARSNNENTPAPFEMGPDQREQVADDFKRLMRQLGAKV